MAAGVAAILDSSCADVSREKQDEKSALDSALEELRGCVCLRKHTKDLSVLASFGGDEDEDEDGPGAPRAKQLVALERVRSLCTASTDGVSAVIDHAAALVECSTELSMLYSSWRASRVAALQRWQHRLSGNSSTMDVLHVVDCNDLESVRSFGAQTTHFSNSDDEQEGLLRPNFSDSGKGEASGVLSFVCLALPLADIPDLDAAWARVGMVLGIAKRESCMVVIAERGELQSVLECLADPNVNLHLVAQRLVPWGPMVPGDPRYANDLQSHKPYARCNHVFAQLQRPGQTLQEATQHSYASYSMVGCDVGPERLESMVHGMSSQTQWGVQRAGAVLLNSLLCGVQAVHLTLCAEQTKKLCSRDPGPLCSLQRLCKSKDGVSPPPLLQHQAIDTLLSNELFEVSASVTHWPEIKEEDLACWIELDCSPAPAWMEHELLDARWHADCVALIDCFSKTESELVTMSNFYDQCDEVFHGTGDLVKCAQDFSYDYAICRMLGSVNARAQFEPTRTLVFRDGVLQWCTA